MAEFTPVIMSGGSGTRLWPVSRTVFPKQMCDFLGESLLARTLQRLSGVGEPMILTTGALALDSARALASTLQDPRLIVEPSGRNTAPALALLCRVFEIKQWTGRVVGVFPADHFIQNEAEFTRAVRFAASCAEAGPVVTLGIRPDYPATGFGYIETSAEFKSDGHFSALRVRGFREKPDRPTAEEFLKRGCFVWNAGIFVFAFQKCSGISKD